LVIDPASFYRAFEQVKDGQEKSQLMEWWTGAKKGKACVTQQLNWLKGFPVNSTSSQALAHCDGQEVAQAIAQVIVKARAEEKCGSEPSRLQAYEPGGEKLIHTAMDGKTLRGMLHHRKDDQPSVHLLAFYECKLVAHFV
jgi:hypothetical protein